MKGGSRSPGGYPEALAGDRQLSHEERVWVYTLFNGLQRGKGRGKGVGRKERDRSCFSRRRVDRQTDLERES